MTRTRSGRFLKGHSGNPGGRPTVPREIRISARGATLDALCVLREVMMSPRAPPAARVQAATAWLRLAYGNGGLDTDGGEETGEVDCEEVEPLGAGLAVLRIAEGAMVRVLAVAVELAPVIRAKFTQSRGPSRGRAAIGSKALSAPDAKEV